MSSATATASAAPRSPTQAIAIIGALFFIFGFVTWLNGPLITFVKLAFGLDTDSKAFWVTTAFYMAYFFLALPSSWILERSGMKKGMALGLLVMALGTFLFGQYATARSYGPALLGLFVIGSGLSLLQTASNPYISIIGPLESAAQRISIMGICNKSAGILSPFVFSSFVLKDVGRLEDRVNAAANAASREQILSGFAASIYLPYMVMAALLVALALWIATSSLPEIKASQMNAARGGGIAQDHHGGRTSILQFPYLLLGALCIFVYVGVEVMAGDAIGTYGKGFHLPTDETKYFTSFTLMAMLAGYLVGLVAIPRWLSQQTALIASAVLGAVLTLAAYFTHGYASVACVAALGLANALMWPAIWPLAIAGLGKFTERGSALLIMGIAGGAIIPKAFASLKDVFDFQQTFCLIMLPCYMYILFYAKKGHTIGR
jgi:glucose/galactose transporter